MNTTRSEHLKRCKKKALEYIHSGDISQSIISMMSDLRDHPETKNHAGIELAMGMLMGGLLKTTSEAERFIESFN